MLSAELFVEAVKEGNDGLDRPVVPAIYVPYTALMLPYVHFLVRTQGDPLTSLHSIRAAIASVASDHQISSGGYEQFWPEINQARKLRFARRP
jgi:hypothetical protein